MPVNGQEQNSDSVNGQDLSSEQVNSQDNQTLHWTQLAIGYSWASAIANVAI